MSTKRSFAYPVSCTNYHKCMLVTRHRNESTRSGTCYGCRERNAFRLFYNLFFNFGFGVSCTHYTDCSLQDTATNWNEAKHATADANEKSHRICNFTWFIFSLLCQIMLMSKLRLRWEACRPEWLPRGIITTLLTTRFYVFIPIWSPCSRPILCQSWL